jgi:hypothetical protein
VAAVDVRRQFMEQIPLVGNAFGTEVSEVVMRVADGKFGFQGRSLG